MDGERLRELRKERGWRAEDLAEKSGVSYRTIAGIEAGSGDPKASTIEKLAMALGVDPGELFKPAREDLPATGTDGRSN